MERKIGEIFEYNGEWYQVVECSKDNYPCIGCYGCKGVGGVRINGGECNGNARKDNKFVIFKKLEKVGEPMKIHNRLVLKVEADAYKCMRCCFYSKAKCELTMQECEHYDCGEGTKFIEIKQTKEDMEEKEPTYEELLHYYHSTVGLWAIDKNPQEVSLDWICDNAFQLGIDEKDSNSENIGKNLREFDLEAAKAGKPVCTRDGRKARIICFDRNNTQPIVALITQNNGEEYIENYHLSGRYNVDDYFKNELDLMMLPEKKEGWVNVYRDCDGANITKDDNIYSSKDAAIASAKIIDRDNYVATTIIKWEE